LVEESASFVKKKQKLLLFGARFAALCVFRVSGLSRGACARGGGRGKALRGQQVGARFMLSSGIEHPHFRWDGA
jgi:hypothetical protein